METQTDQPDSEAKFILLCRDLSLGGLAAQIEPRPTPASSPDGEAAGIYEIFKPNAEALESRE